MSDTPASKEYSDAEFKKIMNKFNTYRDYKADIDEKGNEKPTGETGVVESNDGSNIEERIAQLYSDSYRKYNTVFLGYKTYNDMEELIEVPAEELTDDQKINSQFIVKSNNGATAVFDTLRFHNRPIYCGVNVLYDPTVSDKFAAIANNPTDEYFNNPWNAEYENPDYNSENGSKTCRDLCFSKTFLEDLQAKADDESELVMTFIRKGFDVGIGEVNGNNLTSEDSVIPPMYGRVFENTWRDKIVAYSPVIMQSMVDREIPVLSSDGEIVPQVKDVPNNNCYFASPSIEKPDGRKTEALVDSAAITRPSVIYVGEHIAGYSLFSYINIPVCSWEHFKSKSSGFGSGDPDKPTKVVQRLEDTQCCGPFMRIKAKGYYTSETTEVLRGYTAIKLKYENNDIIQYPFKSVTIDGKEVWGPPEGDLSDKLKAAALQVYKDYKNGTEKPTIRFLKYANEAEENRDELYENAYIRDDVSNPTLVKNIFNEVRLPDRFAFYVYTDNDDTICVAQFPCIPLSGAKPLTDDYITQWVPLYKKIETDPSATEITWYINKFDILVKRGNNDAKFYNINRQKASPVTYPAKDDLLNTKGYIYTCNGVVYKGPSYTPLSEEDEKDETIKPRYIRILYKYVEIIDGGDYSKYENFTQYRKAKYIPDNIQGISLAKPNNDSTYISGPINIAQYNSLAFMDLPSTSNIARASREGYKEFIKNGCVFSDGSSNDPKEYIPDTVNFAFNGKDPETIEPKVEAQAVEEIQPEPEWKKTVKWVIVGIIAVVILGLLVIIGFKIKNAFKGNVDNFSCPGYAQRFA